jgi:LacI family transcriptional regulator
MDRIALNDFARRICETRANADDSTDRPAPTIVASMLGLEDDGPDGQLPSIRSVAARAGVSPSTASRVLRGAGYASDQARERVLAAAAELGYEPHLAARTLKSRSSQTIGIVIQDITNPFYAFLAKGIGDTVRRLGYVIMLSDSEEDRAREAESLRAMLGARVAGVIITPTVGNAKILHLVQRYSIALVQVDRTIPQVHSDSVLIDNFAGAYAGTEHLLRLGHTEIGVIAGPRTLTTGRERMRGYEAAMDAASVPVRPELVKTSDFRRETGVGLARELLDLPRPPSAIFAQNTILAESLLLVLDKRGIRVPDEVAVIGFDDPPWAALTSPPLTVVRQPAYSIGATAADLLLRRLTRPELEASPTSVMLSPTLVVRGSCGAGPGAVGQELRIDAPSPRARR